MAEFKQGLCNCFGDCGVCKLSRVVFCCILQSYLQAAAATGASRARRTRPRRASANPGSSTRSSPASSPASPCCSSDRRPGRGDCHITLLYTIMICPGTTSRETRWGTWWPRCAAPPASAARCPRRCRSEETSRTRQGPTTFYTTHH